MARLHSISFTTRRVGFAFDVFPTPRGQRAGAVDALNHFFRIHDLLWADRVCPSQVIFEGTKYVSSLEYSGCNILLAMEIAHILALYLVNSIPYHEVRLSVRSQPLCARLLLAPFELPHFAS